MTGIEAVLLDAGGTLIHPDHHYLLDRLGEEGIEADEADYRRARMAASAAVDAALRSAEPGTDESRIRLWFVTLLTRLGLPPERLEAVGADIARRHAEGRLWVHCVPGTLEMLRRLRDAGLRLAVISNADGRVARFLESAGLADEFEFILDSGAVGIEKPDRRIFDMALDRMGLAPEQVVYVGDTWEIDVVGARGAGIRSVYLTDGEPREGATCIAGILDLPDVLDIRVPEGR